MSKRTEQFYCNYEFKEGPVNGVEQIEEEHLVELLEAFGSDLVDSVTEDQINKEYQEYTDEIGAGFIRGISWFKEQLKSTIGRE